MDRLGQTRVLRAAALGHLPALVGAGDRRATRARRPGCSRCARCAAARPFPQVPAAMRSLWGALVEDPEPARDRLRDGVDRLRGRGGHGARAGRRDRRRQLAAGRRARRRRARSRASALAFTATVRLAPLARRRRTTSAGWARSARPGCATVFGVLAAFGTAVGIVQVAVPAFAAARGSAAPGGVLLAALSAGSLIGGLVYGARSWPGSAPRRLAVLLLGLGAAFALLAVAGHRGRAGGAAGPQRAAARADDGDRLDAARHRRPVGDGHRGVHRRWSWRSSSAPRWATPSAARSSSRRPTRRAVLLAGVVAAAGAALTLARRRTLVAA